MTHANIKKDCIIKVTDIGNANLFCLRAIVNNIDLDTRYTQLYHIIEVIFVNLAIDNIQAEGTVENNDVN